MNFIAAAWCWLFHRPACLERGDRHAVYVCTRCCRTHRIKRHPWLGETIR